MRTPDSFFYAWTRLPTVHGDFDVGVVKEGDKEHVVLVNGDVENGRDILVRVHSECLTSEVLGSLKCDCKAQLDAALERIQNAGAGVVIYLRQEGRGIGLGDKVRAYRLQESGADTVDANRLLGLHDDLRTYNVAGDILKALKIRSVRLMTNNPEKISGLKAEGIEVSERESHVAGLHAVNQDYVWTKRDRMGHLITSSPDERVSGGGSTFETDQEHKRSAG